MIYYYLTQYLNQVISYKQSILVIMSINYICKLIQIQKVINNGFILELKMQKYNKNINLK
jgi:hypothetical protein